MSTAGAAELSPPSGREEVLGLELLAGDHLRIFDSGDAFPGTAAV
jgi:hypothetical protein